MREAATICPRPLQVDFDLLTLKVVSESLVSLATFVPILVFLGLFVLDLGPMYATETDLRCQTDVRRVSSLNAPTLGTGYNKISNALTLLIFLVGDINGWPSSLRNPTLAFAALQHVSFGCCVPNLGKIG